MIHMVRQLEQTPAGIPLEVYAFTKDKAWLAHENLAADIFDHLYAIAPRFGLKIYQEPSSNTILNAARILSQSIAGSK
jgi:miniconductance mechanosensitive channel